MKKEVDDLDIEILKYLEDDARKSLKKLADELNKKTSTIYHRLQRLKSKNFILGYSIIFNPEFLNIGKISLETIILKPLNITSLDTMFVKSFADFIKNEYPQVLFISLSEDMKTIYLISAHITVDDHKKFIESLKNNPYIQAIETSFISHIVKGQKLFNFNLSWIKRKQKSKKHGAEDVKEGEEEEGEEGEEDLEIEDEEGAEDEEEGEEEEIDNKMIKF
jgi:Lrp/AsnC family transcriptional regulator, leucine-responsive regulatory protein